MTRLACLILLIPFLVSCATTATLPVTPANWPVDASGVPDPLPMPASVPTAVTETSAPADEGPGVGHIILTILALPIILPVLLLTSAYRSPSYARGVSCKGKVYADGTKWTSSCS